MSEDQDKRQDGWQSFDANIPHFIKELRDKKLPMAALCLEQLWEKNKRLRPPSGPLPTPHQDAWDAAASSEPVSDSWIEGLLAHRDECGKIGEAAATDLLREVLRLRSVELRHCSLSGDIHILRRGERTCEVCDCSPVPLSDLAEALGRAGDQVKKRIEELESEIRTIRNEIGDRLSPTHREKKFGHLLRVVGSGVFHEFDLIHLVNEAGASYSVTKKMFETDYEQIAEFSARHLPTDIKLILPTENELARALCCLGEYGSGSNCVLEPESKCVGTEPGIFVNQARRVLELLRSRAA